MSLTSELGGAAKALEDANRLHRGFYLAVARNLRRGDPLFHVRAGNGTTLDMTVTRQEARKIASMERGSRVYELRGQNQVWLPIP